MRAVTSPWERSASQGRERVLGKDLLALIDTFRTDRYNKAVQRSITWLSDLKADHVLQSSHQSLVNFANVKRKQNHCFGMSCQRSVCAA